MQPRRRFVGSLIAGAAGLAHASTAAATGPVGRDEKWLEAIAAKQHRAFLDIRTFAPDGTPFRKVANLRRALIESHGASASEVGIAFGAGSSSIAHVFGVDIWRAYPLGAHVAGYARSPEEAASLRDEPAKWADTGAREVARMLVDGTTVLACRNSIRRLATDFANVTGETPDAVNAKLLAGLHPGVESVPAMIAAAVLAQASNLSYVAIG